MYYSVHIRGGGPVSAGFARGATTGGAPFLRAVFAQEWEPRTQAVNDARLLGSRRRAGPHLSKTAKGEAPPGARCVHVAWSKLSHTSNQGALL